VKQGANHLAGELQSGADEKRILDLLSTGLSTEFPNPTRVGCPGAGVLEGIASHEIPLSEAGNWLEHLGSCSPCFREFTSIRERLQKRRRAKLRGGLAILLVVFALWLVLRRHQVPNETAVLDLRPYATERGPENPPTQAALQIGRNTRHIVIDLPIGSKEGAYDLALMSDEGPPVFQRSGVAQLQDHVIVLKAELDLRSLRSGHYWLALRQPGREWMRFPVRVD
jgi:hypothetical protein